MLNAQGIDKHGAHVGYKSRKFTLTVGVMIAASLFLGLGMIPASVWENIIIGTFGLYMTGHVSEKWAMRKDRQDINNNGIPDDQEEEPKPEPTKPVEKKTEIQKQKEIKLDSEGNPIEE